jgi:hypothetical protein
MSEVLTGYQSEQQLRENLHRLSQGLTEKITYQGDHLFLTMRLIQQLIKAEYPLLKCQPNAEGLDYAQYSLTVKRS